MKLPRQFLILLLRAYQCVLSPWLRALFGPAAQCRFTPNCSQYAIEALRAHGVFRGGLLAVRRLCRCHPWGGCGHDPVPEVAINSVEHSEPRPASLQTACRGH
jgi:uncharacterized protein